jgi:hypothetical protein
MRLIQLTGTVIGVLTNCKCHDVERLSIQGNIDDEQNTNLFAISSLARAFRLADDGAFSTVITASQGGQAVSMEFSV